MRGVGPGRWLLVVALLLLVNVPVGASLATDARISSEGEDVVAEVLDARAQEGGYAVFLRFAEEVDPSERAWPVPVERAVYEQARDDGELTVTAVPGEPGAFEVPGELQSRTGLWMTLLGNVLVAAWVWVMVRRARAAGAARDRPDPDAPAGEPGPAGPV